MRLNTLLGFLTVIGALEPCMSDRADMCKTIRAWTVQVSFSPERKSARRAFLHERGIQQRGEDCLLLIPQDAPRVTGWDTLNPNTVSVRAEEEEKKKNLRNTSWFMLKTLETTYLDPGTKTGRLPL